MEKITKREFMLVSHLISNFMDEINSYNFEFGNNILKSLRYKYNLI